MSPIFKRTVRTGTNLDTREAAVVDNTLKVGQIAESLEVLAEAPLLSTVDAAQGNVISNKQISDFPLNSGSYIKVRYAAASVTDTVRPTLGTLSMSGLGVRRTEQNIAEHALQVVELAHTHSMSELRRAM